MSKTIFRETIEKYLLELSGIKRLSNNTLVAYRKDLEQFEDFIEKKDISKIQSLNDRVIRLFIVFLDENKISRSSISRKLSVLRGYFSFLDLNGYLDTNPIVNISNPKNKRNLPEIITLDSYEKILKLLSEEENDCVKEKFIFELLYGCALRVSEVCNLNFGDIDLHRKSIRVTGKGNKTRFVPFGDKSISIYKSYISSLSAIENNKPVFQTKKKARIYPRYVHRLVNKYLSKGGFLEKLAT